MGFIKENKFPLKLYTFLGNCDMIWHGVIFGSGGLG